ncbi:MAG: T9SS C-terminal target domain-containing protein [Bacteroidetes bacterium]|nr:MAG: T9SS C-terminal target domain-containing protein [Bacteroidota bacterium]REK05688.1 MAG: T9SS C-terminal target domain-containing protein [Bacteroidota bacterium]REK32006.1 MAG: T9SS C-terminal target domain-containing protein [Bacteroidota bacterium]REK50070.1 MAG: T9SS C-terminal target domain-containing protein [Bacteroidota bacterium]
MNKSITKLMIALMLVSTGLSAQTNLNFENWTGVDPNGWATLNELTMFGGPQTTYRLTSNPGQGSSSVRLVTADCGVCNSFFLSDPIGGMVSLGPDGSGVPFTVRPISVDFKYKSNPLNGDIGGVLVELTKWNPITEESDVIGEAWFMSSVQVSNWTNVTLPISYSSTAIPDTISITAVSSIGHNMFPIPGIPTPVAGSEFFFDAVNINLPSCASLMLNVSGTNESSPLASDGTATANVSGGTGPYTYSWSNFATTQSISGLSPGLYSVTVTDANGCVKTGTYAVLMGNCNNLSVTVTGTHATSFTSNNGSATASVTGGTPPYSYQWNNGATTASATGLDVGAYIVMVTDNTGNCIQWGYFTVGIAGTTSVKNAASLDAVKVYPNPNSGIFTVSCKEDKAAIEIFDVSGALVHSQELNLNENRIDMRGSANGMYFYHVKNKEGIMTSGRIVLD